MDEFKSIGFNVSIPQGLSTRVLDYAKKINRRKSDVAQEALQKLLDNTPEVNDLTRVALACQKNGIDITSVTDDLRSRLTAV